MRHVVAVVGGPAQGQLATDRRCPPRGRRSGWRCPSAPGCAPGPGRFQRSRRGTLHGLADVPEVAVALPRRCRSRCRVAPSRSAQLHGVVPGAVGGAEAGHGHGHDIAGGAVQQLHGDAGDQHGQCGSPARRRGLPQPSWRRCAPAACSRPSGLHFQDLPAPRGPHPGWSSGTKGVGVHRAGQHGRRWREPGRSPPGEIAVCARREAACCGRRRS